MVTNLGRWESVMCIVQKENPWTVVSPGTLAIGTGSARRSLGSDRLRKSLEVVSFWVMIAVRSPTKRCRNPVEYMPSIGKSVRAQSEGEESTKKSRGNVEIR
jgi:hypothetical protein